MSFKILEKIYKKILGCFFSYNYREFHPDSIYENLQVETV